MRKIFIIALAGVCSFPSLMAQNEVQALRYSRLNPFGTARYAAQGGSIGALGGDLSAVQENPAGLGFYRSSEFTVTPSFHWMNSTSDYLGNRVDDSRLKLNLGSAGYVSAINTGEGNGIVGAAFALSYNTLANFNNRTTMRGVNSSSSLLDDFTWHANANPDDLNPFYEQVVSDAYLIPYDETLMEYWNDIEDGGYGQEQTRFLDHSGYIGEYSLSGGINVNNLLYFGASGSFRSVRFFEEVYHSESDPTGRIPNLDQFRFREFNTTRGWGYTFRFGMIVRPVQVVRFGASVQIPTYYRLTEEKYTDATSSWDISSGIPDGSASSPNGIYDYRLKSPLEANAHASVIIGKLATVSAAYRYTDYSGARLDAYDDKFLAENDRIRNDYQMVHHLKAGAEVRIESFYLRGGTQFLMSPYADPANDASQWIFSGGAGFRTSGTFLDVSYSRAAYQEVYGLYAPSPGTLEVSENRLNPNNLMVTLGFRF